MDYVQKWHTVTAEDFDQLRNTHMDVAISRMSRSLEFNKVWMIRIYRYFLSQCHWHDDVSLMTTAYSSPRFHGSSAPWEWTIRPEAIRWWSEAYNNDTRRLIHFMKRIYFELIAQVNKPSELNFKSLWPLFDLFKVLHSLSVLMHQRDSLRPFLDAEPQRKECHR